MHFWRGIWEEEKTTTERPWIKNNKEELNRKIKKESEIEINEEIILKTIRRRKNWTAPGLDAIQNLWWKS